MVAQPTNESQPASPRPNPRNFRHGMCARELHLPEQDVRIYNEFRAYALADLSPQDATERFLAEQIINHRWMLLYSEQAECASLRQIYSQALRQPLNTDSCRQHEPGPRTEQERRDAALVHSCASKETHLILRYRAAHERALSRVESDLRLHRKIREAWEQRQREEEIQASTERIPIKFDFWEKKRRGETAREHVERPAPEQVEGPRTTPPERRREPAERPVEGPRTTPQPVEGPPITQNSLPITGEVGRSSPAQQDPAPSTIPEPVEGS